jgi:hypothetical protein
LDTAMIGDVTAELNCIPHNSIDLLQDLDQKSISNTELPVICSLKYLHLSQV